MLPLTLALIDDDPEYTDFLTRYLGELGVQVTLYADSSDLLAADLAFQYGFYIVDLMLPGIDGIDLIKVLRRRSNVGVLVVSGRASARVFEDAISAGADMFLAKPASLEQIAMAIRAVQRRVVAPSPEQAQWRLDRVPRQLIAPDGARIDLSEADLALMDCFAHAQGEPVSRDTLRLSLRQVQSGGEADGLTAAIFRLRRRIERATPNPAPLQSMSRVGYVFRAPLRPA